MKIRWFWLIVIFFLIVPVGCVQREDKLKSKIDNLESQVNILKQRINGLEIQLSTPTQRIDSLQIRLDNLNQRLDELERRPINNNVVLPTQK
jgi:uncharacterized coiled-coil protein SlyX